VATPIDRTTPCAGHRAQSFEPVAQQHDLVVVQAGARVKLEPGSMVTAPPIASIGGKQRFARAALMPTPFNGQQLASARDHACSCGSSQDN